MIRNITLFLLMIILHQGLTAQKKAFNIVPPVKEFRMPEGITADDFLPSTVILRIKPEYRSYCGSDRIEHPELKELFSNIGVTSLSKKFPNKRPPVNSRSYNGMEPVDLSLIYELKYEKAISLEEVINRIHKIGLTRYVEPHYIPKLLYTPNDPDLGSAFQLKVIKAFEAWDISKGDTNIVIGITDTGTDLDHPDLKDNIKYNYNDPVNGEDDDGDGYIDNFSGWDLGDDDNDPSIDKTIHGAFVSGCAAATPDNGIGMAGPAFNCKFLPIKISNSEGQLVASYESIVYAADHGCQIINCSWGSKVGAGQYGQDIINYATINEDALVIAAAGNDGDDRWFFPASYNHVLSVAASDSIDVKWENSSYGIFVDITAPGEKVYATNNGGGYLTSSGTSFATPVVAGCAALLRSYYPGMNALQIGEQLKVTSDVIDTIAVNLNYKALMGAGRVNVYRALTENNSPSIVMTSKTITDGNDELFTSSDTLNMWGIFTNYLESTSSLKVELSTESPYFTILDQDINFGKIGKLEKKDNKFDPFIIIIDKSAPKNLEAIFKLTYTDASYTGIQYFTIGVNIEYIDIFVNSMATTITSKGRIGWNSTEASGEGSGGKGFLYGSSTSLWYYPAGLVVGNSPTQVSDNIFNTVDYDNDFVSVQAVKEISPAVVSDIDFYGVFDDRNASNPMNLEISQHSYAWSSSENYNYVVVKYNIRNNGSSSLDSLYAGIFADWDIDTYNENATGFDTITKMGYAFKPDAKNLYGGIKLLSGDDVHHFAFDWGKEVNGVLLNDGLTGAEKYRAMAVDNHVVGIPGFGTDIAHMLSTGPFVVPGGESVEVAFAILAGQSLAELKQVAADAQEKYNGIFTGSQNITLNNGAFVSDPYPNPAGNKTSLQVFIEDPDLIQLDIYDLSGRKIQELANGKYQAGLHIFSVDLENYPEGMYFYKVRTSKRQCVKKFLIAK